MTTRHLCRILYDSAVYFYACVNTVLVNALTALEGNDSLFIHLLFFFSFFSLAGKLFCCNCCWLAVWDWKDVRQLCDGQFVRSVLRHVPLSSSFLFLAAVCRSSWIHSNLTLSLIFAVLLLRQPWTSYRNMYKPAQKKHALVQQLQSNTFIWSP